MNHKQVEKTKKQAAYLYIVLTQHIELLLTYQTALHILTSGDSQGMPEEVEAMPTPLMDDSQVKGKLTRCRKD